MGHIPVPAKLWDGYFRIPEYCKLVFWYWIASGGTSAMVASRI
jgi:hypothetical protein